MKVVLWREEDGLSTIMPQRRRADLLRDRYVPPKEIDRAAARKKRFESDPGKHTYQEK